MLCSELDTAPCDAVLDASQRIDEERHRRAGADTDDHAVVDELDGLFAGLALGFAHGFIASVAGIRKGAMRRGIIRATAGTSIAPPRPAAPRGGFRADQREVLTELVGVLLELVQRDRCA